MRTFFAARSMATTDERTRTSRLNRLRSRSGADDQQFSAIGDFAADVVRQAAVGERDVRRPLEQHDLRRLPTTVAPGRPPKRHRPRRRQSLVSWAPRS